MKNNTKKIRVEQLDAGREEMYDLQLKIEELEKYLREVPLCVKRITDLDTKEVLIKRQATSW